MYEIKDLEPLVKAGARFLDEREPGWFNRFEPENLRNLNMHDEYTDVLGVLFNSFHQGLANLFPELIAYPFPDDAVYEEAAKYGFDVTIEQLANYSVDGSICTDLETLWIETIVDRQENGVPNE